MSAWTSIKLTSETIFISGLGLYTVSIAYKLIVHVFC